MSSLLRIHVVQFRRVFTLFVFDVSASLEPVFAFLIMGLLREEGRLHPLINSLCLLRITYFIEQTISLGEITYHDLNLAKKVWCIFHPKRKPLQVPRAVRIRPHKHVKLVLLLANYLVCIRTFEVGVKNYLDFFFLFCVLFFFHGTGTRLIHGTKFLCMPSRSPSQPKHFVDVTAAIRLKQRRFL